MKKLIIVGAGGFGRELLQWCKEINKESLKWEIIGFIDDNPDALGNVECDYSVIGSISEWVPKEDEEFAIGIADPEIKEKVVMLLKNKGAKFASIIHPESKIGEFNIIGEGVVIYPGARLTVNAKIGDFVTILDLTTIGHDADIGNFSTICGGCGINGHVLIEDHVFIGSHVTTAPGIKIYSGAYVGTGSVVIGNIRSGYRVFGNPARKIRL